MPPLLGVYDFTAGLPPLPPSGASAYTAGLLCCRCWASTTSPPACLRCRRVVPPPTWLAYYAAAVGRLRLHRRPASVAAEWCLRLHGWPIMPPLLGVYDFTAGLPPSPPTGVLAYTVGWSHHRSWASTSLPTGWPSSPPLLGVYDFTAGLPPLPPSGASAYTAGLLCRRCWASTTSPPACLRSRRVVPPPTRLAYYAAAVGRLRLHRRPASVAAEWCLRLHGWPIMPPLLGVYDFTAGLPPSPPTGVLAYTVGWSHHRSWASTSLPTGWPSSPPTGASACTAGLLCRRCWASTTSPPACLRRRRVVPPPTRLAYYAAAVGRLRLHRRPASVAAEWCLRLHGWPIMPPLLGVYDFTAGLPPSPPTGVLAYTVGWSHHRSWASTSSPPACLRRRRVVPPPTRLAYHAAAVGRLRLHRRPASVAADWCLRLHGWPIMPPLLGVYDFTAGLPPSPPGGASAYTAGLLCRRCWASTTSPPACLRRRRLVFLPIRLADFAAVNGLHHLHHWLGSTGADWIQIQICIKWIHGFKLISYAPGMDQSEHHRRPASVAAEWCLRLHGWPIMPPLLGVYDFTAGLPPSPPSGASAYTAGLLCRRCWASTTSPPACLRRRRVVPPPTRLAYYAAAVGRLRLHRRPASVAADWCLRLHGWPIMPPLLGVYDFTAGLPPSPPTGALAYMVGWSHHRSWASTSSPPACLRRRRLVFPPARLAFMPPLLGVYVFTDRLAFAAADWCIRLHGWPLCRRCWASTSSPTGLPSPPPTGVSACTAGLYAAVVGRLRFHRPACLRRHRLVYPPARLAFMPPLLGVYVFTDRLAFAAADWCFRLHGWPLCRRCWASTSSPTGLPSPPPTGVSACTAGLYAAVVGRLRLHRPACLPPSDWCLRLHGWPLCRRCWASTSSPTGCLDRRRLVFPPARLAYYAAVVGRLRLHRPAAASAADWCHRLHGWPVITPTDAIFFTAGYIAVTTNRHQYLQHKLPTFAMAAD
uniref:cysteine dioxygenase n=1 Tax=Oryza sativa subsp. japonica TaxID=39947 RepID=Q6I5H7_ORYSJ|nr:hypothetical protein [Oryza sativa Japonica Group]